jgi:phosphopantetheinyl transferase (holo-ACP synthase)
MAVKHEDRTIAFQIITFIFFFLFIIFSVYVGTTRLLFSRIMTDNAQESVGHLAHETINLIDGRFTKVEALSKALLDLRRMASLSEADYNSFMYSLIYEHHELECITIAY